MSYAKIEENIDDNGNRTYDVTLESSGETFHANNFTELIVLLEHYYRSSKDMQFHPQEYNQNVAQCPICRADESVAIDDNNKTDGGK